MTSPSLQNNTRFKNNIKSSSPEVNALTDQIWNELTGIDKSRLVTAKKRFLKKVLLNCDIVENIAEKRIRYSRNKNTYNSPSRYRYEDNRYSTVLPVIDALGKSQYICNDVEIKCKGNRLQSTFYPTDKLINCLKTIDSNMYEFTPYPEPIILRDKDGNSIDYTDTNELLQNRKELKAYNDLRGAFNLSIKNIPAEFLNDEETFKILNRFSYKGNDENEFRIKPTYAHRVYNESFQRGGRYYGTIETQIPSELRPLILIDGQESIELDYSSLHIRMIYHKMGIDYKEDAYGALSNGNPVLRKVFKKIGLISINADNFNKAIQGYLQDVKKEEPLEGYTDLRYEAVKEYMIQWMEFHSTIKDYFFSDSGAHLQNIDSKISSKVIKHFVDRGEMILCIHDSYIVKKSLENELNSVMMNYYEAEMGFKPIIE